MLTRIDSADLERSKVLLLETLDIRPEGEDFAWRVPGSVQLARVHRLSFHDGVYLDLAVRSRLPLTTLDAALAKAALAAGAPLI